MSLNVPARWRVSGGPIWVEARTVSSPAPRRLAVASSRRRGRPTHLASVMLSVVASKIAASPVRVSPSQRLAICWLRGCAARCTTAAPTIREPEYAGRRTSRPSCGFSCHC